eukprot:COSAG02_NODE_5239_length_4513_cov_2.268691_1_plen_44_part_10
MIPGLWNEIIGDRECMHGGQKSGRARLEQRLSAPGVPWEGGIAV